MQFDYTTIYQSVVLRKVLACIAFIISTGSISAQLPSYVPSNGLIAWWPFDGNANDESGNAYNGTLQGNTALTTNRNGRTNQAYLFDGNADFIQTSLPGTTFNGDDAMTIAAWIRMDAGTNVMGYSVVSNLNPSNVQAVLTIEGSGAGALHRHPSFAFVPNGLLMQVYTAPDIELNTQQWYHIVTVLTGGEVLFYIDGQLLNTVDASNNTISYERTPPNYRIGRGNPTPGFQQDFIGKIDDVGMWERALTATEVAALYESPEITAHPVASSIAGGQQTTMSVTASAATTMTYQWQRNDGSGFANISDGAEYSGSTSATLTIKSAKRSKAGPYRCVVSTTNASVNSNGATLTVTCPCNS